MAIYQSSWKTASFVFFALKSIISEIRPIGHNILLYCTPFNWECELGKFHPTESRFALPMHPGGKRTNPTSIFGYRPPRRRTGPPKFGRFLFFWPSVQTAPQIANLKPYLWSAIPLRTKVDSCVFSVRPTVKEILPEKFWHFWFFRPSVHTVPLIRK